MRSRALAAQEAEERKRVQQKEEQERKFMERRLQLEADRLARAFSSSEQREEEKQTVLKMRSRHAAKLAEERAARAKAREEQAARRKERAQHLEEQREVAVERRKKEQQAFKDMQRQLKFEEVSAKRVDVRMMRFCTHLSEGLP